MDCSRCGASLPPGAGRCVRCGAANAPETLSPDLDATIGGATMGDATIATPASPPPIGVTVAGATIGAGATLGGGATIGADATLGDFATIGGPPLPPPSSTQASGKQAPTLAPGTTLGTRYHVIRLLGVGGMGAVYHAWDAELGVAVALKVIRSDVTRDPKAAAAVEKQFKQELILARQVTHKHVVRIHDLGDIDGLKYITMPYVEGSDLSTILKTEGKLPVPRALRYISQIVAGLVAAHEAGVVHRDLKPANIMVDKEDQAVIMDFGIARSSSTTGTGAAQVVGTLAYMAPEQAQAKPTDQRADVYALGMMAREMLVGRNEAAAGEQALADLMKRISEAPPALRTIDETIPEPLDALVTRCVQPVPDQRFQSSAELADALAALDENGFLRPIEKPILSPWRMTVAAVVVVATIGIVSAVVWRTRPTGPPKPIDPVSILVADFENKTGDTVFDGALEQPLTIAMEGASFITNYQRGNALKVAQATGNATKLDSAAARLVAFRENVKYVLAGSVSASGGRFQLTLDAVNPGDGKVEKSASATAGSKADVLTAVGALAAKMRSSLGEKALDKAQLAAMETFTAGSIEAMREYSQAQDLQNAARNEDALAHYQKAIEIDPKFGRAYSGAANMMYRLGRRDEADTLWKQAMSMMDRMTDREKYRTLGSYYNGIAQNYDKAVENYSALIKAYPIDAGGHSNLALAYFYLHDFANAAKEGQRAIELDPKNLTAKNNQGLYAMYAGDFANASSVAKKVLAENANFPKAYLPIAMEATFKGDIGAAIAAYDGMEKAGPSGASLASIGRADLLLYSGDIAAAETVLKAGIDADLAAKFTGNAAHKQIALAEAEADAGRRGPAAAAARAGMKLSRSLETIVPAARVLRRTGNAAEARQLAAELEGSLQKQSRAYGKILLAEIALDEKKSGDANDRLTEARQLADVWLGRYDLGIAFVQAGAFSEAISELEACEKRRGEATALFFDDVPTVRYLAALPYWIGRAQEGLNMKAPAKARYEEFLKLRKDAAADPLLQDARRRAAGL